MTSRRNPKVWQNSGAWVSHPGNFKVWWKKTLFHKFLTMPQKEPPHFYFKTPTFLLFDSNRKTLPTCQVSQLQSNCLDGKQVVEKVVLEVSHANEFLYHAEEYYAACCNIAFLSEILLLSLPFLGTVLVKRQNPPNSSKKIYLYQSTNQGDRQAIKGVNVPWRINMVSNRKPSSELCDSSQH